MTTGERENIENTKVLNLDDALESIPVSYFHYLVLFMCGLAFMADAMEISLLSFLSTCASVEWNLSDTEKASITSLVFVGEIFGTLVWGQCADRFGRKRVYLLSCSCTVVGGILTWYSPSYSWLLVFRTLVGFGVGGFTVPFDLLAEFTPRLERGRYLFYMMGFWTLGSMFVNAVAWVSLASYGWRTLSLLTALPVSLAVLISFYYLPESPRWLLTKGRAHEAEQIIAHVAMASKYNIEKFTLKSKNIENSTYFDLFKSSNNLQNFLIPLFTVWCLFGFTYYGLILFVARIFTNSNTEDDTCSFDYSAIFVNSSAELVGVFVGAFVIDVLGRRGSQVTFYSLSAVFIFAMGFSGSISSSGLMAISWFARLSSLVSNNSTWVITPELFPTSMRGTGHSFCNMGSRIGAFCCPYFVSSSSISLFVVAIGLTVFNVLAAIISMTLPETSDKSLDDDINCTQPISARGDEYQKYDNETVPLLSKSI